MMGRKHHPVYARGMFDLCEVERAFEETFIIYLRGPRWTGGNSIEEKKAPASPAKRPSAAKVRSSRPRLLARLSAIRPSVPRLPTAGTAGDGLKHFGIRHSSIYKEREQTKNQRAANRARYVEAYDRENQEVTAAERAVAAAEYIEGGRSDHGERVVWRDSNIGDTYEERVNFFSKTADAVAFKGDATVEIDIRGHESEWANIKYMPREVREVYQEAVHNGGRANKVFNNTEEAAGFTRSKKYKELLRKTLTVKTPPNGIVCSTVVVPIPHELSARGKRRYARKIVKLFSERNIRYQAVIHEPVAGKNDARNWHMHINYWPFECRKLESGKWSFERIRFKSNCGHWRDRMFEAPRRIEETKAEKGWVKAMKIRMCELANETLLEEGLTPRFTAKTNLERGLDEAEKAHGPRLSARLKKGEVTEEEIDLRLRVWRKRARRALKKARGFYENRWRVRLARIDVRGEDLDGALDLARQADKLASLVLLSEIQERMILSGVDGVRNDQEGVLRAPKHDNERCAAEREQATEIIRLCDEIDGRIKPLVERTRRVRAEAEAEIKSLRETLDDCERIAKDHARVVVPVKMSQPQPQPQHERPKERNNAAASAALAHQRGRGR